MSECILWTRGKDRDGYGVTYRNKKWTYAHRVAYVDANGLVLEDIKGKIVRHQCDTPACINPEHLVLGTIGDNNRDTVKRGRRNDRLGSLNHFAKLNEAQVAVIKKRLALKQTSAQICVDYGVTRSLIDQIRQGKIWREVSLAD